MGTLHNKKKLGWEGECYERYSLTRDKFADGGAENCSKRANAAGRRWLALVARLSDLRSATFAQERGELKTEDARVWFVTPISTKLGPGWENGPPTRKYLVGPG